MTDVWAVVGATIIVGTAFTAAGAVIFYLGVQFGANLWYRAHNNMPPEALPDAEGEPEYVE